MDIPHRLQKKLAIRLWRWERNRGINCEYVPAFNDAATECLISTYTGKGQNIHSMTTCDNSATGVHRIVAPQCYRGKATRRVTVTYSHCESDTLELCDVCAKVLKRDVRKHGYRLSSHRL